MPPPSAVFDELPDELPADRLVGPVLGRVGRLALGAGAVPVLLGYAAAQRLAGAVHTLAARLPAPAAAEAARPLRVGSAADPDVACALARVRAVPAAPTHRSAWFAVRAGFPDWALMVLTAKPAFALLGFRYPRRFRHRVFVGADGQPIAAMVGLQRRADSPAVVVVHGALSTKHFDYVRRTCVRLFAAGYHVLAPDLRGFGVTALTAEAPSSCGYREGEDVVAAAEWLRARGATSVGAVGFSLGATVVLNGARASAPGYGLDGGVLSLSSPADLEAALLRVSTRPPVRDRFFGTWLTFRAASIARARAEGWTHEALSPADALRRISAPYYGLPAEELLRRAGPLGWIGDVRVPVLALHACDDVVVPVAHARALAEAAAGNPSVAVLVRPHGAHAAFHSFDPGWLEGVEEAWFGSFARWGAGQAPGPSVPCAPTACSS